MSDVTVGSLFSGIGGIELGLEMAGGFKTRWFVERDSYASAVLNKHWPGTPVYADITAVDWAGVEPVDMLTGGFPCQDISNAGKRKGITGERSGLWKEYLRAIRSLRPRIILVENVSALTNRGLDVVLGDLSEAGYDAEWFNLRASDVGAPHRRERLFIVAYLSDDMQQRRLDGEPEELTSERRQQAQLTAIPGRYEDVPDADKEPMRKLKFLQRIAIGKQTTEPRLGRMADGFSRRLYEGGWLPEPEEVPRVTHERKHRKERLMCLGNAVVPQVAYVIGMAIKETFSEEARW